MALTDSQGNYIGSPSLGDIQYEYDYFSGSQINLMLGDVVLDAAVGIQFNVEQSKAPVYGYASQYYSFVADGKVIVQGALTIAFKEAGYLFWPIQRFLYQKSNSGTTTPRYAVSSDSTANIMQGSKDPFSSSLVGLAEEARHKKTMKANVEQMMEWSNRTNDGYSTDSAGSSLRHNSKYNQFVKQLGALSDDKFEDMAETFEDAIWFGSDTGNPYARDKLNSKNLALKDFVMADFSNKESDELILSHRRADQYPELDIWITYGDVNRQSANHTVKKLLDVSFVGQAQQIEISGKPCYEVYHFIAKNLV